MTKLLKQKKRFEFPTNATFLSQINAIAYHNSYIYVTGHLRGNNETVELGNGVTVTTQNNAEQVFVAKFNHQLVAQNATTVFGGSEGHGIAVTNYGVYITGFLRHAIGRTVEFGNDVRVTTQNNAEQVFVAKFNHQLVAQNARVFTTNNNSQGRAIAVNNSYIYVTGLLRGNNETVEFGNGVRVTADRIQQIFVAKFNHHLVAQNARVITTDAFSQGNGIAVTNYGVYITGNLLHNEGETVELGNNVRVTIQDGFEHLFVAKFNHQLVAQNAHLITGFGDSQGNGIAVTNYGVYITGNLRHAVGGTFDFGNHVRVTTQNGNFQVFVAKFNHQLVAQNARVITTNGADGSGGLAIAVNNYGVYITGEIDHVGQVIDFGNGHRIDQTNIIQDIFIVKYNHQLETQAVEVVQKAVGSGFGTGTGIALSNNSVYVCGHDNNNLDGRLFKYSLCNHITQ